MFEDNTARMLVAVDYLRSGADLRNAGTGAQTAGKTAGTQSSGMDGGRPGCPHGL